ncbi:MAG: hypothetical protein CMK36_09110 [Porticoccaceae bacterium]|nr:hypothetical protein [Porticoccaceae bacterium]
MRDGYCIAKRGLPVVALITDDFWEQGQFMAESIGMPDLPRLKLPHPVAGTGENRIEAIANTLVDKILDSFSYE